MKILKTFGLLAAIAMIVAALWTWRHAARLASSSGDSSALLAAVRCGAIALAAGAQVLAIRVVTAGSARKDRLLRGASFALAAVCGICVVSAAALGIAGR